MDTGPDLAELASAAAARMIELLTTDVWASVRTTVLSWWRHAHPERVDADLTEARDDLLRAEPDGAALEELRGLMAAEWQARLARLLAAHPEVADEVRQSLTAGIPDPAAVGRQTMGSMTIEAHVTGGGDAYLAGRDQTITRKARTT